MSNTHHTHNHDHHSHSMKGKPLVIAILLNLAISIAQFIGGLLSGSLALMGDALHNFSDVLSLIISYTANKLAARNQDEERTFGFKRAQILAAFINAFALIGISIYLIIESIGRLWNTEPILSNYVIWLAIAGIVVNGGSVLLLSKVKDGDSNMSAAYLHLIADLATSIAVLIGGLAMHFFQIYWVDSAITIVVSVYLIYMSSKLFLHTTSVLMQFAPSHLAIKEICDRLCKVSGVKAVHHVHLWRLDDEAIHFEAHVLLEEDVQISKFELIKAELQTVLKAEYDIIHSIFQPEISGNADELLVFPQE